MNNRGANKLIMVIGSQGSRIRLCSYPAIVFVAGADMDATYGAYLAAENNTFNDTNNTNRTSNR